VGFTAGPKHCDARDIKLGKDDSKGYVRLKGTGMGSHTFVPWKFRCLEMGSMYNPAFLMELINRTQFPKAGKAVKECQRRCKEKENCAYFSLEFPARLCSYSANNSWRAYPVFKHVTGPPSCSDDDESDDDVLDETIRQFLEIEEPGDAVRNLPSRVTFLTLLFVSASFCLPFSLPPFLVFLL